MTAVPVSAQVGSAVTITNGNVTYTQGAIATGETPGVAEVLNGSGGDILYQHWWWFRVAGDTREFSFKADANATRVASGSSMTTTWPDVDSRGVFSATLQQDVFSTGATSGYLREIMTIQNLTANPLAIDLFAYTDFDVAGAGTDLARGNLSSQGVIDQTNTVLSAEFFGLGNTGNQVGAFATVRTLLTNTAVDNLAGWNGSFGAGDYTGAMQWTLMVPANGSASVLDFLATMACRPQLTGYGAGGAGVSGVPTINTDGYLLQNAIGPRPATIGLGNGAPNALAACLLSLNQGNSTLLGINILVDLGTMDAAFTLTDPTGAASRVLNIPPTPPALCGINLFSQWLVSDTAAANGVASWSAGLQMLSGGW
ncbi:MAG: hypothetical protein IPK26_26550 [Planctomycetes bacterium]|nr:hypothetical protein [Planctomycetota bacterium]